MQGPFGYLCFSKTQALSPRGRCRTFDESADGIVISEGIAMLALKRLSDAERDGDRVYAVIKGMAGSSDGKAKGLTAPLPAGQLRAHPAEQRETQMIVGIWHLARAVIWIAGPIVKLRRVDHIQRKSGIGRASLIAIQESASWWARHGFRPVSVDAHLAQRLTTYGAGACYMQRTGSPTAQT